MTVKSYPDLPRHTPIVGPRGAFVDRQFQANFDLEPPILYRCLLT